MGMFTISGPLRQMAIGLALCNGLIVALFGSALAQPADKPLKLVAFGDSLTAGYQLPPSESFPGQLERALKAKGHAVTVINAGVSGDTTAAGLERLQWSMPEGADAVVLALGANDAMRGLDPGQAKTNLDRMIQMFKARGVNVLLVGMYAPRSMGEPYVKAFDGLYAELAKTHDVALYPFFLDGVALKPGLNLADGIHPNAKGVAVMVEKIMPSVEALIARTKTIKAAKKS
jgi:acyl-CoA thioesterase I